MTQEEKARAYDEAIKKAESLYKAAEPMSGCNVIIETLFPELKESEDEKVRKALIEYFNEQCDMSDWNGIYGYQVVSWLEKQGKQKNENICSGCINRKGCINCEDGNMKETLEQNHAWSEEDERFVHGLIRGLAAKRDIYGHTTFSSDCIDITETIDWLKSLRPQNRWKPSERQLVCLQDAIEHFNLMGSPATTLNEILKQLKKLKEEQA